MSLFPTVAGNLAGKNWGRKFPAKCGYFWQKPGGLGALGPGHTVSKRRLECGVYPVHINKFNAIIWTRKRVRSNTNVFYFLMIHSKLCNFETQ